MSQVNTQPEGNPKHAYLLNFSPKPNQVKHEFCGTHTIGGATCPNCNKPLLRILSLSAKDPALNLDETKTPSVHLLYCWTCSIPFGEFSYKVRPDGGIEFVQLPGRIPESEFGPEGPYDGYTGVFPAQHVSLEPMDDDDDAELSAARTDDQRHHGKLFEPRHQIGGSPLIYNPQTLACPSCSREMPLIAAISDDATGNDSDHQEESKTFTGNSGVQMIFQLCRDCAIVSAYHSCD